MGAGSYALAAATPAAGQAALQALVFTPAAHQVPPGSAVSTDFAVTATNDGAATASGTASVVATAALDPPVLGGTVPNQPAIFGVPLNPFTMVTIADPDAGTMETAAIILLSSTGSPTDANGTLTGAGLTKNGVGSYSLAPASTAAEQAALEALSFTPTPNQAPAGSIVATQFLLSISDGSLATSSNGASIVAGNSNPVTVTGVSVNPANSILGSGASAVFTLQMSAPVSVTGAPTLA